MTLTVQMLDSQFVLVLQFLQLLLGSLFVMFLVLRRGLNGLVHVFAYKKDLAVFVIYVFWLDFCPG